MKDLRVHELLAYDENAEVVQWRKTELSIKEVKTTIYLCKKINDLPIFSLWKN